MTIFCSPIWSLLFLSIILNWSYSASLHLQIYSKNNDENSSIVSNEVYKSDSTYFQLPLIKRLRRWNKIRDNDEVEIPVDDGENSDDISNSTYSSVEVTKLDHSIVVKSDTEDNNNNNNNNNDDDDDDDDDVDDNNAAHSSRVNSFETVTSESNSEEDTTMAYAKPKQSSIESSTISEEILQDTNDSSTIQTNFSSTIVEEVLQDSNDTNIVQTNFSSTIVEEILQDTNDTNTTQSHILSTVPNDQTQSSTILTAIEITTIANSFDDKTTISMNETERNHTYEWNLFFNDKTETLSYNDSYTVSINNSTQAQDEFAGVSDQDIHLNYTDTEINQNLTETFVLPVKSADVSICDQSCQCLKECPYGFNIENDTCTCDSPCKNYHCFGNDTCIITDKGQPICQPENGTEYDRPTRCYQPRDAGYHDVDVRYHNRWYYNPDQNICHLFIYRGLGGNENNFLTLRECHLECITCAPSADQGECLGHINMWYYDSKINECKQFEYSGCKGNENKFLKEEQCVDTCVNRIRNR